MAQAKKSVDALRGVDNNDDFLVKAIKTSVALYLLYYVSATAYRIRLQAINEYGTVIHEFDPYFNFRATEVSSAIIILHCMPYDKIQILRWTCDFCWFHLSLPHTL